MRPVAIGLLAALALVLASLPAAPDVSAGVIFLDGGASCTGQGDTDASGGAANAHTTGCSGSNRYLAARVYYSQGGDDLCDRGWVGGNLTCQWGSSPTIDSVWADHNLCYAWCNGYVQTYDYW
jgi:hypothetical protein